MRELKFRCWDIRNKKFINTTYDGSPGFCIGQNGEFRGNVDVVYPTDDPAHELYIITQYTGLKDKNGKNIYEGDIIKYPGSSSEVYDKVIFDRGSFMVLGQILYVWGDDKIEIIGNIFENPELLKNSQQEKSK